MKQPTAGTAWIPEAVLKQMVIEAERVFPLEAGGVLVGYWGESDEVVITNTTGSGPRAIHRRYDFSPDAEYQEAEIARFYEESGGAHTYLGDWHTHPRGGTYLSQRDVRTLRKISTFADARAPMPIMAVLAGGEPKWFLGVWRYAPTFVNRIMLKGGAHPLLPTIYSDNESDEIILD
jgi:integrative and conjugative element protein (TIGR02256 family)